MEKESLLWKTTKIIWLIIGILILLWTGFWFVKMFTMQTVGVIATVVLFAAGVYLFFGFILITIAFLILRFFIRKIF